MPKERSRFDAPSLKEWLGFDLDEEAKRIVEETYGDRPHSEKLALMERARRLIRDQYAGEIARYEELHVKPYRTVIMVKTDEDAEAVDDWLKHTRKKGKGKGKKVKRRRTK